MARNPIVAGALIASLVGAPLTAYAQDDTTTTDQPTTTTTQPTQQQPTQTTQQAPPVQPVQVKVEQKGDQDTAPPPPRRAAGYPAAAEGETISEYGGPSQGMLFTGIGVLGVSYAAAAVAGMSSSRDGDRNLVVPIAGPWIALANRPSCDTTRENCDSETTNKVLIVTDGVFQAVGGALIIGSFLSPRKVTKTRATTTGKATIHITPTAGRNGAGIGAFGTF